MIWNDFSPSRSLVRSVDRSLLRCAASSVGLGTDGALQVILRPLISGAKSSIVVFIWAASDNRMLLYPTDLALTASGIGCRLITRRPTDRPLVRPSVDQSLNPSASPSFPPFCLPAAIPLWLPPSVDRRFLSVAAITHSRRPTAGWNLWYLVSWNDSIFVNNGVKDIAAKSCRRPKGLLAERGVGQASLDNKRSYRYFSTGGGSRCFSASYSYAISSSSSSFSSSSCRRPSRSPPPPPPPGPAACNQPDHQLLAFFGLQILSVGLVQATDSHLFKWLFNQQ